MPHFIIRNPRSGNKTVFFAKHAGGKYRPHIGAKEQAKWAAKHKPAA